jgi:hypothetical protein
VNAIAGFIMFTTVSINELFTNVGLGTEVLKATALKSVWERRGAMVDPTVASPEVPACKT